MIINKCIYNGKDIGCGDGVCTDCNWYQYQLWTKAHAHCDQVSWDCPDEQDCPYKIGLMDTLPPNNIVIKGE